MIDDPPRELVELFLAERAAPSADAVVRAGVRVRLAASLGRASLAGFGIGKILAILALTVGAGTAIAVHSTSSTASPTPPLTQVVPTIAEVAPQPRSIAVAATPAPPAASARATVARRDRPAATTNAPTPLQAALIREAWLALSLEQPERALSLVDQDAHLHPNGVLAEERDAVQVIALARLGRREAARAAASAFLAAYPQTIHRELVARALADTP